MSWVIWATAQDPIPTAQSNFSSWRLTAYLGSLSNIESEELDILNGLHMGIGIRHLSTHWTLELGPRFITYEARDGTRNGLAVELSAGRFIRLGDMRWSVGCSGQYDLIDQPDGTPFSKLTDNYSFKPWIGYTFPVQRREILDLRLGLWNRYFRSIAGEVVREVWHRRWSVDIVISF